MTYEDIFHGHILPLLTSAEYPLTAKEICSSIGMTDSLLETVRSVRVGLSIGLVTKHELGFVLTTRLESINLNKPNKVKEKSAAEVKTIKKQRPPTRINRAQLRANTTLGKIAYCLYRNADFALSQREIKLFLGLSLGTIIKPQLDILAADGSIIVESQHSRYLYRWSRKYEYPFQCKSIKDISILRLTKGAIDVRKNRDASCNNSLSLLREMIDSVSDAVLALSVLSSDIRTRDIKEKDIATTLDAILFKLTKNTAEVKELVRHVRT